MRRQWRTLGGCVPVLIIAGATVGCAALAGIDPPTDRSATDATADVIDGAPDSIGADGPGYDAGESAGHDAADAPSCSDGQTPCGGECCDPATTTCAAAGDGGATCARHCNLAADCPNGCCAPVADVNGNPIPVGSFICKPADGKPYDCAVGTTGATTDAGFPYSCGSASCPQGLCPVNVANGSCWCEKPCSTSAQCGSAACAPVSGSCNGAPGTCLP